MASRSRVVLLTVVVALAVVQPALAGSETTEPTRAGGDVGLTVGAAVERHPSGAGATAEALRAVRADAVHERGHTGAGVSVGVIGQGFDASGALDPHVAARTQVGEAPRATAHDSAVAEVVSETAPDSNLYLAGVGPTPTPAEYAAAVEWLTARGVDVIVDAGSYFPSVAADERRITAAAERATDRGVVFVTSAGNYADRHWAGEGTTDGWVTFADGDAANALADGDPLRGRVTVRLRWRTAADYDLYLYRRLPNGDDRVVAKSVADETGPGLTVEGIDVVVPRGRYYVAVYAADGVDGAATPGRVQVFATGHELEHVTTRGSMVAPATGERVVAVGAATGGDTLAYSSRPTAGTVDLTAPGDAWTSADPTFTGTSAAAPYVAGTAALVKAAGRDPSPARVEAILERTAGGDGETVDALAAVEAATASDASPTAVGTSPDRGSAARASVETDDTGRRTDVTARSDHDPRPVTDGAGDAGTTNAVDRSARNVTRPAGSDGRSGDGGADGADRSTERNDDGGTDQSPERDRQGRGESSARDGRERRDGSPGAR